MYLRCVCINFSFIAFTEFLNSPTAILNLFGLEGTFSMPSRVRIAAGIARGQISKATRGWLRACRKTHAPLAPRWIQKERKRMKKFTSKQVRQLGTSCTAFKGKVISADSDLRGTLWSAPICSAGFSHLPLEIEWEWIFFPSSKRKKRIKKKKTNNRFSQIKYHSVCGLSKGCLKLISLEPWKDAGNVLGTISVKDCQHQGQLRKRACWGRWLLSRPSSSPSLSVHIRCSPCWA